MGTNYYLRLGACEHCGRADDALHIGKSSAGWTFGLHVDSSIGINSLDDWKARWKEGRIFDEYGDEVSPETMLNVITERSGVHRDGFDYAANHVEPGPNGLVRRKLGEYCVGHGEGTWDLCPGCFS